MKDLYVRVTVPDDLAQLRSREWFRSEFATVCEAHLQELREMLTTPRKKSVTIDENSGDIS